VPRGEPAIARHRLDGPSFELAGLSRARSLRILGRSARENGGERESVPGTFAPGPAPSELYLQPGTGSCPAGMISVVPSAAIDPIAFREVCGHFVTGVGIVTSFGEDGPAGLTANALVSLSLEPPLMIVCFDRTARTLGAVEHSRTFGIHFLSHDQEEIAALFASKRPEAEKFGAVTWSERSGVPVLAGCVAGMACVLEELASGGDHVIGIGRVVDLWKSPGDPLVFFQGDYWALTSREPAPPEVDEALEGP
jgi:flavin reductase (DIM6/NTAB) family NADH-FMN oxidoreductase RutF